MIRNALAVATLVLGLGALGACAKEETSQGAATVTSSTTPTTTATTETAAPPEATGPMGTGAAATPAMPPSSCPMAVAGTNVETKETPTGMNMIFKTTSDVTELRRRVREMATRMSSASTGTAGAGGMMMMMMAGMPPVRTLVRDIDGGAQIEMAPVDAANMGDMRQHVQSGAQAMAAQRGCPMRQR
ncbi:MAG TPA: hypothetical protein VLM85_14080 [Polyangiaceae bacterium]|nr:hypothetical protein [Polyangiaceae bacterium]